MSQDACRAALGGARFRRLAALVAGLPGSVDRDLVYQAISDGLDELELRRALGPEWCRRRDKALDDIWEAITGLRSVLEEASANAPPGVERTFDPSAVEILGPLERAYADLARLAEHGGEDGWPTLLAPRGVLLLSVGGGRPPAWWRDEAEDALRDAGVPREAARRLLAAAGRAEAATS